jgi:hypothetical protein
MARSLSTKSSKPTRAARAEGGRAARARGHRTEGAQSPILALQQTAGNQAISQALEPDSGSPASPLRETLMSEGQPLDPTLRSLMENRFGRDFGQVRVHTGPQAAESADALHSEALTVGQEVVFGKGNYAPDTSEGKQLLAHELAHVVQQTGGTQAGASLDRLAEPGASHTASLPVGRQGGFAEREAERAAAGVTSMSGNLAQPVPMSAAPVGIHLKPRKVLSDAELKKKSQDADFKQKLDATIAGEKQRTSAKAGPLRAQYENKAGKEPDKGDFSALGMDKPHQKVERTDTPMSEGEVKQAIMDAWRKSFGTRIPAKTLGVLVGKWYAEGGTSEAGIHNYNIGNLEVDLGTEKDPKAPSSDYSTYKAKEYTKGKKTSPYASYDSAEQGAMGLIHFINQRPALKAALMSGKPEDYVYVAKAHNYFEAPVEDIEVDGELAHPGYLPAVKSNVPKPEKLTETGTKADILQAERNRLEAQAKQLGGKKRAGQIDADEYEKSYKAFWESWNQWSSKVDALQHTLPTLDKDIEPDMQPAVEKGRQRVTHLIETGRSDDFRKFAALLPSP